MLGLELDFVRPLPTAVACDFTWTDASGAVDILWNYKIQLNQDKLSQVKELIQKAHQEQLNDCEVKVRAAFTLVAQRLLGGGQRVIQKLQVQPQDHPGAVLR